MEPQKYLKSRVCTLKPTLETAPSPLRLLRLLDRKQWLFFWVTYFFTLVAFIAWAWDAFDFFSAALVIPLLSQTFGRSILDITLGLTLVLMFRSLGAVIFGIAADRFGRKWPFVVNNILLIVIELATGFCQTYEQFLACRALFGVAMGGLYGNTAATALEDCPKASRGIISGILQSGYPFGYLLATAFTQALVTTTRPEWRSLFWFGACPPLLIIIFRLFLPETDAYKERFALRNQTQSIRSVVAEVKDAIKRYWLLLIYLILLMAGLTFIAHLSQDLFSTFLSNQYNYSITEITKVQVAANLGGCVGGTVVGYLSQIIGRRFSIVMMCFLCGTLLYPYFFISGAGLYPTVFFMQFFVQGAWGIIPIHLIELSPASYRAFVVGTSYQLGNLISAASSTIEARISQTFPLPPALEDGVTTERFYYSPGMTIFLGCVLTYTIIVTALGPERRGRDMVNDEDDLNADGLYDVGNQEMGHGKW